MFARDLNLGSLPHVVLLVLSIAILIIVLLRRGHIFVRATLVAMSMTTIVWMLALVMLFNLSERAFALPLARVSVAPWSIFGPAMLAFLLAIDGTLYRHRRLVTVMFANGLVLSVLCATTDLVVADVYVLDWGGFHPSAGPLLILQAMFIALPIVIGIAITRHGIRRGRFAFHVRYGLIISVLAVLASIDGILLCYGIGAYPFAAIPGIAGTVLLLHGIIKHDLLHARGFDRATAYEALIFCLLAPVVVGIAWASHGQSLILALLLLVPIFGGAQAAGIMVRRHLNAKSARSSPEVWEAVERFADSILDHRSHGDLTEHMVEVLEKSSLLSELRLWVCDDTRTLRQAGQPEGVAIALEGKLHGWLTRHATPLDRGELPILRLSSVEGSLDRLFDEVGSDVILPLSDRGRLVGMISAAPPSGRVLADNERQLLRDVGSSVAKSLAFINLFVEAEKRIEIANELDVAAAVKLGRPVGEVRQVFKHCQILGCLEPAARFGGAWWSSYELPDERVLVVIGDVSGTGVAAALVSSTAAAACQTAQEIMGASCDVSSLLGLLDDAVRTVGDERYEMDCCAVLVDARAGRLTFANSSRQTLYLVRPTPNGLARLVELHTEGSLLGITGPVIEPTSTELCAGDFLVLFSAAAVDSCGPTGERFGEQRLLELLENQLVQAGDRAHRVLVDAIAAHRGEMPLADDLTVVVIRITGGVTG